MNKKSKMSYETGFLNQSRSDRNQEFVNENSPNIEVNSMQEKPKRGKLVSLMIAPISVETYYVLIWKETQPPFRD